MCFCKKARSSSLLAPTGAGPTLGPITTKGAFNAAFSAPPHLPDRKLPRRSPTGFPTEGWLGEEGNCAKVLEGAAIRPPTGTDP